MHMKHIDPIDTDRRIVIRSCHQILSEVLSQSSLFDMKKSMEDFAQNWLIFQSLLSSVPGYFGITKVEAIIAPVSDPAIISKSSGIATLPGTLVSKSQ